MGAAMKIFDAGDERLALREEGGEADAGLRPETDGVGDVVEIAGAIFLAGFVPEDCSDRVTENKEVMDFGVQIGSLNAAVVAVAEIILTPDQRKPTQRPVTHVVEFFFVERG